MQIKSQIQFQADQQNNQLFGFYDIPNDVYHASPGISKSGLDMVNRSPAHYKYSPKREATPAMRIGTILHSAILEPDLFTQEYMLLKEVTDKRKSEYKEAVKIYGAGNVLTAPEVSSVHGMQEAVNANAWANDLLTLSGMVEVSLFAPHPVTGVLLKCRFDKLTECGKGIDLKTTQDASEYGFSKSVNDYRYHVQQAFYSFIYKLVTGDDLEQFYFIALEKDAPHFSKVWTLSAETVNIGVYFFTKDLESYTEAVNLDYWAFPDQSTQELSLPNWALNQFETEIEQEIK